MTPVVAQPLLKQQRVRELAKPQENHASWVKAGYLFTFLGLFIGLIIATNKKTLPDGQRVYAYPAEDRKHGWIIFSIGNITFALNMLVRELYMQRSERRVRY